jgi:DNA-binding FadR family transcriptional regulator
LESIGLIEVRRGSGLFLRESFLEPLVENLPYGLLFDLEELEELLEVRRVLETGMISQAIAAMTDERIAELEQVLSAIARKAALPSEFPEEDRAFHRLLHQNVGNRVLLKILDAFWLTFHKAVEYADLGGSEPLSTYLDHASILEAVRKHDIVAAREALDRHYAGIQVRLARLRLKGVPP